ncbi:MAG: porin [Alphaproteobacteria bacterium]|nr:porin [Alphaproteobacteria bacterium]
MKKILLGSTVLVGTAALFAGAAFAGETPKVTLGGVSDFQVGIVSEDRDTNLRSGAFKTETDLSIKIDAKTDAGLGYGGEIVLDVSNTDDADNENDQVGKSYVYLDGAWGRLEGGSNYGAASTMKVDASRIARATGGIDGDFNYFMSATTGSTIATPDLILDYGATQFGDESQEAINKVTYYTPRFMGFQAGVSYLFDSTGNDRGTGISRADNNNEAENVFVGGINYDNKFGDFGVAAAVTGEFGDSEVTTREDLRTWNAGAKVAYMGFSLAGSYGSWGDSLQLTSTASDEDTMYWTLGGAYEYGPFGASVTYLNSEFDNGATENEFDNLSVGVDYKLAPGLTPYAEVSFVEFDNATGTANDNDATVFIAGTQLAF